MLKFWLIPAGLSETKQCMALLALIVQLTFVKAGYRKIVSQTMPISNQMQALLRHSECWHHQLSE